MTRINTLEIYFLSLIYHPLFLSWLFALYFSGKVGKSTLIFNVPKWVKLQGICQQRCGLSFPHFVSTWVEPCIPFLSKVGCCCYGSSPFLKNPIPRQSEPSSFLTPQPHTKMCINTHPEHAHSHFSTPSGAVKSGQLKEGKEPVIDPSKKTAVLQQREIFPL